jgi:hypothetical protein
VSTQSQRSNIVSRSNVYQRQPRKGLHSDTAYVQRVRGGHSIKLVAKTIVMAVHDYQITALVQQSAFFTLLQKRDYADRFIRAAGSAAYGWDVDADGRIVWKPVGSLGSRLLAPLAASGGTTATTETCWFIAPDGRIDWGALAKKCRPLLEDKAHS